jgi:DNA polymerase elongation subunit (family B)
MVRLQPCDWHEHDTNGKFVVDVFGRTDTGTVACLRINGFKPYFYVRGTKPDLVGVTSTKVQKYDVFAGFADLKTTEVWKVVCDTKAKMMDAVKISKGQLYESNLPGFMRFFHDRHINPASAIQFTEHRYTIPADRETEEPLYNIDAFYQCDVDEVSACEASIPLKVACYDLEMYSKSGLFPQAKKETQSSKWVSRIAGRTT